jgi:hypothetical protein
MHNPPPTQKPELPIWVWALIGSGGTLLIFLVGYGIWNSANSKTTSQTTISNTKTSALSSVVFPQAYCGDQVSSQSSDASEMYPIYTGYSNERLEEIKLKLCPNATKQEIKGMSKIQIASFSSIDKAREFQSLLKTIINDAEIGDAILFEKDFSGSQELSLQCDSSTTYHGISVTSSCPIDGDKDGYLDSGVAIITFKNISNQVRTITFEGNLLFIPELKPSESKVSLNQKEQYDQSFRGGNHFEYRENVLASNSTSQTYTTLQFKPNSSFSIRTGVKNKSDTFKYPVGVGKIALNLKESTNLNLQCKEQRGLQGLRYAKGNGDEAKSFGIYLKLECNFFPLVSYSSRSVDFSSVKRSLIEVKGEAKDPRVVNIKSAYKDIEFSHIIKINSSSGGETLSLPTSLDSTYTSTISIP